MGYTRDADARTRSVGAIAAIDNASSRSSVARRQRARMLAEQDRALAQFTRAVARPQSMGAVNANIYGGLTGGARRPQITEGGMETPTKPPLGVKPIRPISGGLPGARPPTGSPIPPGTATGGGRPTGGRPLPTRKPLTEGTPNTTVIVDPGPEGRIDPVTGKPTGTTSGGSGSAGGGGGGGGDAAIDEISMPDESATGPSVSSGGSGMSTGKKVAIGIGIAALAYYLYTEGV